MAGDYPNLFTPLKVGHVLLRNRLYVPAHQPGLAEDSLVSDRYIAYQRLRARSGAAMQITGRTNITVANKMSSSGALLANVDDRSIPGFQRLANAVHAEGGRILSQLGHSGPALYPGSNTQPVLGPSRYLSSMYLQASKPMSNSEIERMIFAFVKAAERCQRGDLDGIEISMTSGQLLAAFLSPLTNLREDEWGGSLENRLRFPLAIARGIRVAVGQEFIVGARITGDELVEGGLDQAQAAQIGKALAESGDIDYLSVLAGTNTDRHARVDHWPPTPAPHGLFRHLAATVKEAVGDFPVACVGRITDVRMAEEIIANGEADLVGMVRAHIADPMLIKKARSGQPETIRPCVGLNVCVNNIMVGRAIQCPANPELGREDIWPNEIIPDRNHRRVVIVGGGPAGLEAARILGLRGHEVSLFEAQPTLGGQMYRWSAGASRKEARELLDWWARALKEAAVDVHLGHKASADDVLSCGPDYAIVATGAIPMPLDIDPGTGVAEVGPFEALDGAAAGDCALVVDAVGRIDAGLVAEKLRESFARVTIATQCFAFGEGEGVTTIYTMLRRLAWLGVEVIERAHVCEINDREVRLTGVFGERRAPIAGVDTVVPVLGRVSVDDLSSTLLSHGVLTEVIGDALNPRRAHEAVLEGAAAGRNVWTNVRDKTVFAL